MTFTFDPACHAYRLDGKVLPSVTQVLSVLTSDYFARIPPEVLERKRQIGQAVHAAIALDLAGDLDESSIDPAWEGYFQGWRKFRSTIAENDIGEGETPGYHRTYLYAGTPDLELRIYNGAFRAKRWALVDFKCTWALHPAVGPQTAAYQEMRNASGRFVRRQDVVAQFLRPQYPLVDRYALHLGPQGTYKLESLSDKNDFQVFLSALNLYRFREKYLCNPKS